MVKRYLTGSCLFFSGIEGFTPHDCDYCELDDEQKMMFVRKYDHRCDVFSYKRATADEYVSFALSGELPDYQLCQYLTPGFCREVGFTIEHLKKLKPLRDELYNDFYRRYTAVIYDFMVENNGFYLTTEQQRIAYAHYYKSRNI